jgi:hypothetical protein
MSTTSISLLAKACAWDAWETTRKVIVSSLGVAPHHRSLRSNTTTPFCASTLLALKGPLDSIGSSTIPVLNSSGSPERSSGRETPT